MLLLHQLNFKAGATNKAQFLFSYLFKLPYMSRRQYLRDSLCRPSYLPASSK